MAHALDLSLRCYESRPLCHSHDFHQVVLPLAGCLEMDIAGRGGRVAGCQAALIAAGSMHSCEAVGPNRFVVVDWRLADDDLCDLGRLADLSERRPYLTYEPRLMHLVRFLGASLNQGARRERMHGWATLLLSELAARATPGSTSAPRQLGRAIAFMQVHLGRRIGVEEIARAACTSGSHLHALFRRHLDASPMDHLAELRLDEAMTLLADSDLAISEIALRTGHADQSVLTRSLQRRRGITPAAYRRRIRDGAAAETA